MNVTNSTWCWLGNEQSAHPTTNQERSGRDPDGRRYLVLHGDQCDPRFLRWHFMTRLGSRLDALLRQVDDWQRKRSDIGPDERSPAQRVIDRANQVMAMGDRFERRLIKLAQASGTMGVICGHSHKPALRRHGELVYANCGDWIDSLTALALGAAMITHAKAMPRATGLLLLAGGEYDDHREWVGEHLGHADPLVRETALDVFLSNESSRKALVEQCNRSIADSCAAVVRLARRKLSTLEA